MKKPITVRNAIIVLCFLGSILLAILGGWNYMKGRILFYEESVRIEKILASGQSYYNAEEELKKIRKGRNNGLIMFAAGFSGFFLSIAYIQRSKQEPISPTYKTK